MTASGRYLYMLLITTLLPMVVIASNTHMLPAARKSGGCLRSLSTSSAALSSSSSNAMQGFMENRISTLASQNVWTKKFLAKREAEPHSAPSVVSIQLMTPDEGLVHYCAGTIINEHWILTAAHCLTNPQMVANSVIVAGCHDIHSSDESHNVQLRHIDYFVSHDLYLGGANPYDIALIYTKEPLIFDKFVQPANLPEQDAMPDGYGTLYGWGNVSMTIVPKYPHKLQQANMPILDLELCEQVLASSGMQLHETNLCTGPLTGGVSICTADSGGPLMQDEPTDMYGENAHTIIGIVSWGKMPCGQRNAPSVFVRVSAFSNWIQQVISTATQFE
ncbi:lectizyme [Stomoxys calcitrans]|uniref:Peptidase S1 domain-containing protein n=1 Tax=Stomoxys calcitrans TaxID=35570 RepID=A0A1I8PLN9_STOCA|nr:lectizyme [Stomoxys calcitrans]